MTIAAGFPYDGGILICSDTQFTIATAKLDGIKIGWAEPNWGQVMIACAGNVDFATGAYQTCLQKSWTFSSKDALGRFAGLLEEYYRRHVFGHPLYEANQGNYEYNFLLGIRMQGAKARLFTTSDTVLRETGAFECIGCGVDVARPMLSFFHDAQMSEATAVAVAAHVIHYVKKTVDGCGGHTLIRVLRHDGTTEEFTGSRLALHIEKVSNFFTLEAARFILTHTQGNSEDFKKRLARVNGLAFQYRDWWEQPGTFNQEGSQNPESTRDELSGRQPLPE